MPNRKIRSAGNSRGIFTPHAYRRAYTLPDSLWEHNCATDSFTVFNIDLIITYNSEKVKREKENRLTEVCQAVFC